MKLTDIFIRRPVLAIVISFLIVIAGLQAYSSLTVRQYPRSDNAVITVKTAYVGASPELVRGFVTTPLERVIAAADGIDYVDSQSSLGFSTINAHLKINYEPTKALSEISAKVNQVRNDLPEEAEIPVINIESADSQFASVYLSFSSDSMAQNEITDYLSRVVQPQLSALEGVQRAEILGARTFAMRIWLKPERMAAMNVSPIEVRQALAANNALSAIGQTKGALIQINLTANTDLHTVEEFQRLVVRQSDDGVVRIEDIADVVLGSEDYSVDVRFSGKTAVFIGVWALPTSNTLDVVTLVRKQMILVAKALPSGMSGGIAYDSTEYIDAAIHDVLSTLAETLLIVVVVIFLFLGSMRSAMIPVLVIPLSIIGTLFLMQIFGFTVNLLTLLAIVLSVGLVVDDAIVVVENVERHLSEGQSPLDAAIYGARELMSPVIAMTITLAAVYLPIGLQGGLTGSLFREFAFTLAGAVTISGIIALTLSPMMASRLLKPGMEEHGFAGKTAKVFHNIQIRYGRMLDATLRARPAVYLVWIVISLLAIPMFQQSAKELAPVEDQGIVFAIVNTPANGTLEQISQQAKAVNDVFLDTPETAFTFQLTTATSGFGGMITKPWDERERSVYEITPQVQAQVSKIPGVEVVAIMPPALPGGGQFPVEFVVTSTAEAEQILEFAQALRQKAATSGLFAFPPIIDTKLDQPQASIVIDRDKVSDLGLSLAQVSADLGTLLGGAYVNRFNVGGRSYKVIPQVQRENRLNAEQLRDMYISGPQGDLIPVSSIATIEYSTVARSINRMQQLNAIKLSGVAIVPLDDALAYLETEAAKILPPGYGINYTGESRQLRTEGNKFVPAFSLAVLLIYLVLAVQFNSFRDPFVILAGSVPLAIFGALIFTFLKMPNPNMPFWTDGWTTTLNIYSQVGLVTLVGLVAKNGILIVEFANHMQLQGHTKLESIRAASMTRLRPILMTTIATVAGHFPLTLVDGAGAAARNSIGLVLVGGMFIGTLFTLFIIPSIYMLIAKDHTKDGFEEEKSSGSLGKAGAEAI